jgi:hypothetical protein
MGAFLWPHLCVYALTRITPGSPTPTPMGLPHHTHPHAPTRPLTHTHALPYTPTPIAPHTPTRTHIRIPLCAYTHNAPGAGPRTHINILSPAFTHGLAYIHAHAHIHPRTHIGARRLTLLAPSTDGSLLTNGPVLPTWPAPAEIFAPECRSKCPRPAKSFKHFSRM